MRLRPSPFTKSNFLHAKRMYQQGMSLGSVLTWPIRSRMERPYVFKLRDGTSFLTPHDGVNFQLLWRENWVEEVYAKGGIHIAPEATVVVIGANIGLFSIWAATRCERGRVIAVEPSPTMADFVRRNAARNRKSITVLQVACGGAEGKAVLYTPYGDEAKNTLHAPDPSIPVRALADVEVVTLKELFKRSNVEKCDLLKIDCEGSEYDILLKSPVEVLDRVHQIALEYHPGFNESDTPGKLEGFLKDRGFRVCCQPLDNPGFGYMYARKPS